VGYLNHNFDEADPRLGDLRALCSSVRIAHAIADPNYQLRVWINQKGPERDCYDEALCSLFDDAGIERFLDGYALDFGFSHEMLDRLKSFVRALRAFDLRLRGGVAIRLPENIRDADIVALPDWTAVMRSAADFLDLAVVWFEANCSDALMYEWSWGGKTFGHAK
jgi:hypothetical protein